MDIDDAKWYMIRDPKTGKVWTANGKAARQTEVTLETQLNADGDDDTVIEAQQWAFVHTHALPGINQDYSGIQSRLEQENIVTYGDQEAEKHKTTPFTIPGKPLRMFFDVADPSQSWTTGDLAGLKPSHFPWKVSAVHPELWIWTDGTDIRMQEQPKDKNGRPTSDPQDWVDQGYTWELVELGPIDP